MSERSIRRRRERDRMRLARRGKAIAAGAAMGGALVVGAPAAVAADFEVTNLDDTGEGSLRHAIAEANANGGLDTITFESSLSGTIDVGSEMLSTGPLTIVGPGSDTVTLDGGDATRILRSEYDNSLEVTGLTFTRGFSNGNGGAVRVMGPLRFEDVVITDSEGSAGGGVSVNSNEIEIRDSVFTGNRANYAGGGVFTYGDGGGDPSDEVLITGSTISGNEAVFAGGGISFYDSYADVTVDSSTVSGNTVAGSPFQPQNAAGGGIWFEDTYVDSNGNGSESTVKNSTITGNSTPGPGGGVAFTENFYGPVRVVNTTIAGNSARIGGGVQFADALHEGSFELANSTVAGNEATEAGGGVWFGYAVAGHTGGDLTISSAIVGDNTAPDDPDLGENEYADGEIFAGNSLLQDPGDTPFSEDPAGTVLTGVDPDLGPLQDNGGGMETRLPKPSSPVINAGLANGLAKDQRGSERTVEYPGVANTLGSDGTDMGAVELEAPSPPPDNKVIDPFLEMKNPQLQSGKKIKLKVKAGAGEEVTAIASGRIRLKHGNAVRLQSAKVAAGKRVTLVLKPQQGSGGNRRIKKALRKGRKAKAEIDARLIDTAGNKYYELLTAKLKLKKKK